MQLLRILLIISVLTPVIANGNDNIKKAMSVYKEKKYDQAVNIILRTTPDLSVLSVTDKLKSALIFSKNLKLYQDIYRKSKSNQQTYLSTLVVDDTQNPSTYAKLYLAEVFILNDELDKADALLSDFSTTIANDDLHHQISQLYSSWIKFLKKDKSQYESMIKKIDKTQPLLNMAINFLNIQLKGNSTFDTESIKKFEPKFLIGNEIVSTRFANYAIKLYVNNGKLKEAQKILIRLNQQRPSYVENLSPIKILRFYEITLIDTIAEFYYNVSKSLLKDVSQDKKYHDMAIFYLSELDLVRLNMTTAKEYMNAVDKLRRLPKNISNLTEIRSTAHGYLLGQTSRARQAWQDAVNNFKNDPNQSSDAVLMCIYLSTNCPKIVQTAQLSAENGRSKRFEALSTNVGRYFLLRNHNNKALRLLSSAMDRSNTNSLLANDPLLLLNYADALRLNKNYAESLQIYFSLGENFPIIRQIQDAVQGEYLFRQRANGTINVF